MDFEQIKNLLGEAYTEDVENAIKSLVEGLSKGGQEFVPKAKYDKLSEQLQELTKKTASNQDFEKEREELQKKLDELQTSYTNLEENSKKEVEKLKNDHLFEKELSGYKPRNLKALSALIDKDKLTFGENGIDGLKEQVEELQKSNSFLFESESVGTGIPHDAVALKQGESPLEDATLRKCFGLEENKKEN